MNSLLLAIGVIIAIGLAAVIYLLLSQNNKSNNNDSLGLIKQDLQGMLQLINQSQAIINERIDKNNTAMQASVHKQMSESSKLIADVTERLAKLDETNKRVVDVADELKTLQNVLQNPKQRGVLGEYYLQNVLDNVLPADRYKLQYKFKNGEMVDAVIFLEKSKILPIDSKFSLDRKSTRLNSSHT